MISKGIFLNVPFVAFVSNVSIVPIVPKILLSCHILIQLVSLVSNASAFSLVP